MKRVIAAVLAMGLTAMLAVSAVAEEEAHPPHVERGTTAPVDYTSGTNYGRLPYKTIRDLSVVTYVHTSHVIQGANYAHALAVAEAQARAAAEAAARHSTASISSGTGACSSGGGNWQSNPNAKFVPGESSGNYCVPNSEGSGACGAYQIMPETWNNFEGYASACDAPPAVQDRKAATMAPCNWQPPNYCRGG